MASRASRIAYVLSGLCASRWHAAPIPERPAPTISTSKCSVAIHGGVSLLGMSAERRGRRAARGAAREEAAAQEGSLERAVAVHASAAEAGHLACGVEAGHGVAALAEHARLEVGL